jgi:hypothetical protein
MKRLSLLLLLLPLSLFSQVDVKLETSQKETFSQERNAGIEARSAATTAAAAATEAEAARSAAMGRSSTEVLVPITVDLNNYTHIALVSVNGIFGRSKAGYNGIAAILLESLFVVVNPTTDRKRFKQNPLYLRDTKNPDWLYLYYTRSAVGVNELRDITVRDWKNQIMYSAKNINISTQQVLQPLINF